MGREEGYKKNNKNNDDEIKFVRPNWYEYDSDDYDHDCGRYRTFCIIHYVCRQLRDDLRHLDEKNNNNKPHKKRKRVDNPTNPYDPWPKRVYTCDRPNSCGMAINEGDIFDVASLLSSSSRDYLINNKRNKVNFFFYLFLFIIHILHVTLLCENIYRMYVVDIKRICKLNFDVTVVDFLSCKDDDFEYKKFQLYMSSENQRWTYVKCILY